MSRDGDCSHTAGGVSVSADRSPLSRRPPLCCCRPPYHHRRQAGISVYLLREDIKVENLLFLDELDQENGMEISIHLIFFLL